MTTTTAVPPAGHGGPARLARAFLTGGEAGTASAAADSALAVTAGAAIAGLVLL
jgi:hypothetical protein